MKTCPICNSLLNEDETICHCCGQEILIKEENI